MTLPPNLQSQLEDLELYPDRADRIEALIAIGEEFRNPNRTEFPREESCRVPGCESEAFVGWNAAGELAIAIDNPQGISAMAMAQILLQGVRGATVEQVRAIPDDIIYTIFGRELSMGKSMGLTGMVRMVKQEFAKTA